MSTFSYSQVIATTIPEEEVDQHGLKLLRDAARAKGLTVIGPVQRTHDEPLYAVQTTGPGGEPATQFVPALMAGEAVNQPPAARAVTWAAETRPSDPGPVPKIEAARQSQGIARADLPDDTRDSGGLVRIDHNLGGEVTVSAYDASGQPIGYLFATEITDNALEIRLLPGASWLQIILEAIPADEEAPKDN